MNPERYEHLQSVGCVCCQINSEERGFGCNVVPIGWDMPLEAHHLNAGGLHGGKRLGDDQTIPLCGWHHRGVIFPKHTKGQMMKLYGPSWVGGSKQFRPVYGSDADLLTRANKKLKDAA